MLVAQESETQPTILEGSNSITLVTPVVGGTGGIRTLGTVTRTFP